MTHPNESPLERYKALWLRLDALDRSGLLESPEAEAIREESEGPWYAMSEAELVELRKWVEAIETKDDGRYAGPA